MKKRLDLLVVEQGLAPSREQARAYIMAGLIFVDGQRRDKAGESFDENVRLEFHGRKNPYVSRGGLKLEKALAVFPVALEGRICMDIGASTGGFTDCMLQKGAGKVYAVDVGYGQLAYSLRTDPRVICMEKTNVRYLEADQLAEMPDFASIDVSFISLKLVLPVLRRLLAEEGEIICLVKPQFEAGRDQVGKKGVVRDPTVHRKVLEEIIGFALSESLKPLGLDYSPVKGPEGNIEYLLYLQKAKEKDTEDMAGIPDLWLRRIPQVVKDSHDSLDLAKED